MTIPTSEFTPAFAAPMDSRSIARSSSLILGQNLPRVDARAKVLGQALYAGDLVMPGMLHMKVLFARRPHARILSLDTAAAEALPGVHAVFTARDVPVNEFGLIVFDAPVLCSDTVRWVGDKVAVVVADTEQIATRARDLIRVEYQDLPPISDALAAMQPGAPLLFADKPANVLKHYRIRRGDVAQAFAQAGVVVEGSYETPMQEHAYLQPEAGLAWPDGKQIVVACAGQWQHEERHQVAHALGLTDEEVRIVHPAIGGAFGGREDISVQIVLALAARKLGRPVKIIWSREESLIGHHKRHAFYIQARWSANYAGKITAAEMRVVSDCGPYAYTSTKVLGNATLACLGPYEIPNVAVDSYTVLTTNVPGGAFRGFGGPQGHFAAELQIAKLAEKLGLDPVELRSRNILREGSILPTASVIPAGVSIDEVMARCAESAGWVHGPTGWQRPPTPPAALAVDSEPAHGQGGAAPLPSAKRRGLGMAIGYKNIGFSFGFLDTCTATVELYGGPHIERALVRSALAEVGQGAHTMVRQVAAETLNLPVDRIDLVYENTDIAPPTGSASASRITFMVGNAVKSAAEQALRLWQEEERPAQATFVYHARPTTPYDPNTGASDPNITYGYVAQAVEVEVDTETGQLQVLRVITADDVGRAINPRLIEGQIEGAVAQALGWATIENFIMRDGRVLTPHFSTYLIPTVLDVPERMDSLLVEHADPQGPFGARGMAEMPYIALAPALAAAVHDATGVWFDRLPLLPERVLAGLSAAG